MWMKPAKDEKCQKLNTHFQISPRIPGQPMPLEAGKSRSQTTNPCISDVWERHKHSLSSSTSSTKDQRERDREIQTQVRLTNSWDCIDPFRECGYRFLEVMPKSGELSDPEFLGRLSKQLFPSQWPWQKAILFSVLSTHYKLQLRTPLFSIGLARLF